MSILVTEKQQWMHRVIPAEPESPRKTGWDGNDLSRGDSREWRKWCPEPVPCGSEVSGGQEPGGREGAHSTPAAPRASRQRDGGGGGRMRRVWLWF